MKATNENLRILKPFLRGIPIIVVVVAVAMALAKRYLKYATPVYESTAKIRLADTKDGSPGGNLYKDFDVFVAANKIGAELEVLKSKVLIDKALDSIDFNITTWRVGQMRKIELYNDCPFIISAGLNSPQWYDKVFRLTIQQNNRFLLFLPGSTKPVPAQFNQPVTVNSDTITISANTTLLAAKPKITLNDNYEFVIHSREKLVDMVSGALDVGSIDKEIPILRINFKSPVAQKAADFVNQLAKTYVQDYIETKTQSASTTVKFLDDQLHEVGGKLSASENAIESYRDKKRIINIRQETETDLRKIADMKVQQTNVKMNLEAIESLYSYMKNGRDNALELAPNFEAYTDLLATEMVKKMKLLQSEKKELLLKYTPEHEQVKVIDAKLGDITRYLEEGINNTRKNLQIKYNRISRDITEAESVFNGLPTREKTMGILNRDFMLNEQTYNFLRSKKTEAQIAQAATIAFHRIISPGNVPKTPVSPNASLLKVLAAFLGFLGSVALIYLVHALKGKVNDSGTIEKKSAIPIAAGTPMLRKPGTIRSHFHKLAIQLELKNMLLPNTILALTSFSKKEGKSFNVLHLAKELVNQEKKVLVVDADGAMQQKGMVPATSGFTYASLPAMPAVCTNSEVLKQQFAVWKQEFDHILIKNEPLNNAANGLLLMKIAEANLFIMDSRRTPAKMVTEAELLQQEYQFSNIQFLLNRAGYNPNLIMQGVEFALQLYKKIVRR